MSIIVSKAHKALVIPHYDAVTNLGIATTKLEDGRDLIDHTMRNTFLLRRLGLKVPNPMMYHYDWCAGVPFVSQQATCEMLTENPRAYVLNHMGTGKTKAALWAYDYLHKEGAVGKLLVVCKKSNLYDPWTKEIMATVPHLTFAVLEGSKKKRLALLAEDKDVYIINHDGIKVIRDELHSRSDVNALVLDELAVYRNNSDRSKQMRKFAQRFSTVWGLTGAPVPNEVTDVWAQAQIVTPGTVPKYFKACREMLMFRISQYEWRPKPDGVERAFSMMQPSVRFSLDDVVELPPIIERTIDVPLTPQQKEVYDNLRKYLVAMAEDKQVMAQNAGAAVNKMLQIAGGWVYSPTPENPKDFAVLDAEPRITTMLDLIEEAEQKVLVLVPYRHMIEGLTPMVAKAGFEVCMVHGDTKHREVIFNEFQNTPKYKVMVAQPGTIGHGLTLTAADTIIWYLPVPDLDIYDQANARIRRVGQVHKQQILHLQSTGVEKRFYRILRDKQKVQDAFLTMIEEATSER